MGWDWNPVSWLHDAESAADSVGHDIDKIWHWVEAEAVRLGNKLNEGINDIGGYADSRIDSAWDQIKEIARDIGVPIGLVAGDVSNTFHWLEKDVHNWINDALRDLDRSGSWLWNEIKKGVHDAEKLGDSGIQWFDKHILDPAIHDLHVALHDVEKGWDAGLKDFEKDVVKPIERDVDKAWADAVKAVRWIDHAGYDAVKLVEQCWDFLEMIANHPVEEAQKATKEWLKYQTTAAGSSVATEAQAYYGRIVDAFEAVL
jgi:hypothetical protein